MSLAFYRTSADNTSSTCWVSQESETPYLAALDHQWRWNVSAFMACQQEYEEEHSGHVAKQVLLTPFSDIPGEWWLLCSVYIKCSCSLQSSPTTPQKSLCHTFLSKWRSIDGVLISMVNTIHKMVVVVVVSLPCWVPCDCICTMLDDDLVLIMMRLFFLAALHSIAKRWSARNAFTLSSERQDEVRWMGSGSLAWFHIDVPVNDVP